MTAATAILVAKGFSRAKTRLTPVLTDRERAAAARSLFGRTLSAIAGAPGIAHIALATDHAEVAEAARAQLGSRVLEVLLDRGPAPLGQIVDDAVATLGATRAPTERLLVLMGDLPSVTAEDVDALVAALRPGTCVVGPDRHEQNTNALGFCAGQAFPTAFGSGSSFSLHRDRAAHHGLEVVVVNRPGVALDVDDPTDWRASLGPAPSP